MKKRAAKKPARKAIREVILQAIEERGESILALSKQCGVSQPQLSRFVIGGRDLRLRAVEKLCETLGLELRKIDDSEGK